MQHMYQLPRSRPRFAPFRFALALSLVLGGPALAQLPGESQTPPAPVAPESVRPTKEDLEARRAELAEELTAAKKALADATASGTAPSDELVQSAETLERIDRTLERQIAQLGRLIEQDASAAQWEQQKRELDATPGAVVEATFLDLEALRAERAAATTRGVALRDAVVSAQRAVDQAKTDVGEKEKERRRLRDEVERAPAGQPAAAAALTQAERAVRLATETLALRRLERDAAERESGAHDHHVEVINEQLRRMEATVRFTEADLAARLDEIAEAERPVEGKRSSARLDLDMATRRLSDARDRRDRTPDPGPALVEEVEAYRQARETRQSEVVRLDDQAEDRALLRDFWNRRYQVANDLADDAMLRTWQRETGASLERLGRSSDLYRTEIESLRRALVSLEQKLESATDPSVTSWLREQIRHVRDRIRSHETSVRELEGVLDVGRKLAAEINTETDAVTLSDRWKSVLASLKWAWSYEITSIDDRPITVAKIVIGLMLLMFGMFGARVASRVIGRRVLPRLGVTEGGAAAVQTIFFYLLVVSVFLVALHVINVPLTAFTILGGAFAIGIGFGSQNLMNNFISGLILLVERPIRVGDLIMLGDLVGVVEHIGARSTLVRRTSNVDIIVPNSTFLESNVINWTLSDDTFRTSVSVGVVYGSPLREVSRLIRKAVDEHGRVLKSPDPILLFTEFGADSLNFEIHFWIHMRREMDRRRVESDLRFRIDSLFREAGIVIAFPQRDVHLDTVKPLDVRIVTGEPTDTDVA